MSDDKPDPPIHIRGVALSEGEKMTMRVALIEFRHELMDKEYREKLGPIGDAYLARCEDLMRLWMSS